MEKYLNTLGWMAVAITLYMEVSYFYQVISDYGSFGFRFHFDTILFLMNNMLWVGHGCPQTRSVGHAVNAWVVNADHRPAAG